MSAPATTPATTPAANATQVKGMKKNGKNWHATKKPFRPGSGLTSYAKRVEERKQLAAARIQKIKERRAAKEEKARYEKMAEKMHHKRVERLKRREKRNKLLNS
ncbi:rRNA processing protein CgrA [Paecilomyces variotii]|uniref:rRNA-processing protein n=1 Tax=Byssochlamys spectabilis TaxID=264951 RepID=A0A443I5Y5_BYSSP|nr:rRNA processing protein CgrA [Paecilomyces variotii]RWQ99513.1 rRNA processing protein CgrA [Paecilomyces variotii]